MHLVGILVAIILNSIGVFVTASILPGIEINSFLTAVIVSVVLGLVNAFIRPIIFILTLPINILTLGLFTLVINGLLVLLVTYIVPGFVVHSFLWAIGFALVLSIINSFIHTLTYRY